MNARTVNFEVRRALRHAMRDAFINGDTEQAYRLYSALPQDTFKNVVVEEEGEQYILDLEGLEVVDYGSEGLTVYDDPDWPGEELVSDITCHWYNPSQPDGDSPVDVYRAWWSDGESLSGLSDDMF